MSVSFEGKPFNLDTFNAVDMHVVTTGPGNEQPYEYEQPYELVYSAQDAQGNRATISRFVHVTPKCLYPSFLCSEELDAAELALIPEGSCATCTEGGDCTCLSAENLQVGLSCLSEFCALPLSPERFPSRAKVALLAAVALFWGRHSQRL